MKIKSVHKPAFRSGAAGLIAETNLFYCKIIFILAACGLPRTRWVLFLGPLTDYVREPRNP